MTSKFAGQDVASWVGVGSGGGVTGKAHIPGGHGGAAPSGEAAGGVKSTNKDVDGTVATMQNLMVDLGTQLSKPGVAQSVVSTLQQQDPNTKVTSKIITDQAVYFARTGSSASSRAAAADGVWGKNTRDALLAIKKLVEQLNIKDVIISEGTGTIPYQSMKDAELIEKARENINNISRIFGALGIQTSVESVAEGSGMIVVDVVDPSLPDSGLSDPFGAGWGNQPVTMGNLADLLSFFDFMSGLKPHFPCNPLDSEPQAAPNQAPAKAPATASLEDYFEKLANEILDRSIFRLGQNAEVVPVAAPAVATPVASDSHCLSVIEESIKWFLQRANEEYRTLYAALERSLPSPRPDRKGKIASKYDAQIGKFYAQQMENISNAWDEIKNDIINAIKAHGNPKAPIVTRKMIRELLHGASGTTGKAHQRRDEGEGEARGRTVNYGKSGGEPPLGNFIIMQNFPTSQTKAVADLTIAGLLPQLNINDWSFGGWEQIALSNVAGEGDGAKYANFGPWAAAVRDALRDIYNKWSTSAINQFNDWKERGRHDDRLLEEEYNKLQSTLEKQHDLLGKWEDKIRGILGVWGREYKERMERARKGQ
jgi:hypothetical protein